MQFSLLFAKVSPHRSLPLYGICSCLSNHFSRLHKLLIKEVGSFLAVAIYQDNDSVLTNPIIYKMYNGKWVFYQCIKTHNAQAVDFLIAAPSNTPLLVVANKTGTTSPLYKWDCNTKQFTIHQHILVQQQEISKPLRYQEYCTWQWLTCWSRVELHH